MMGLVVEQMRDRPLERKLLLLSAAEIHERGAQQ
jgi:hypothetical protein